MEGAVPSPKSQAKVIAPSRSEEPAELKSTAWVVSADVGVAEAAAVGAPFGAGPVTVIKTVSVAVAPPLSVTVSVTK